MDKVPSGIEGFDKLIFGGFPKGRAYLISGEPGTGKTVFCLQYLLAGARLGQKGIYISIDEKPDHVLLDAKSLGWELDPFLKNGLLQIIDVTDYFATSKLGDDGINSERIIMDILGYVQKSHAVRLAIDPIAPLVLSDHHLPEIAEYIRRLVFAIEDNTACTSLITSYIPVGEEKLSLHGVEEFAASGIVALRLAELEKKVIRTIWVRKMRGTRIDLTPYSFEILPRRGIVLRQPI